jgi:hypothetical protein
VRAGEVLGEAWSMYRAHFKHLIAIAFAFYLLLSAIALLLAWLLGDFGRFIGALIGFAGVFWIQGALVTAIEDVRDGRADLTVRETIEHIRPQINRLSFAAIGILIGIIFAALVVGLGFILLVIPGVIALVALIIFAVRWSLLVPVLMLEQRTVLGSLDRSQDLVRGHTLQAFLVVLGSLGFWLVVAIAIGLVLAPLDAETWIEEPIRTIATGTLIAPFAALALTLMYYRLLALKGTPVPERVAAA